MSEILYFMQEVGVLPTIQTAIGAVVVLVIVFLVIKRL
jgi:hypothetical protein